MSTTTVNTATGTAKTMVLNMGPQHPSTHGVLRVVLELDGERIVKATPEIGYLHTGIEKTCEAKTYSQAITLTDRLDYLAPLSNNLGYCLAVEKLLGLEVPKRAQYVRVLLTEMTRIASHLVWIGTHAIDLGAMSVFLYCFREREEVMKIFEMVSGQRMMTSYFRIGGLALEPATGWLGRVERFVDAMPGHLAEYENLLTRNRIWLSRLVGVGVISAEDAIGLGMSGPSLRSTGMAYDVRKFFPYSSYEEFEFDVPTRTDGDCYSRYLLRVAEIKESLKIVRQAMAKVPTFGAIRTDAPGIVPPARELMKTEMESLIYHFKIFTEG
ncbi:MAG TPA: NADH-quinone oxidoreductase subunit D, partial [Candidatus Acidoferrales bacterium]|nr:NADH-quinone oxidoreductase subunit D [Candidatus Acidoferrales bacterium]